MSAILQAGSIFVREATGGDRHVMRRAEATVSEES